MKIFRLQFDPKPVKLTTVSRGVTASSQVQDPDGTVRRVSAAEGIKVHRDRNENKIRDENGK